VQECNQFSAQPINGVGLISAQSKVTRVTCKPTTNDKQDSMSLASSNFSSCLSSNDSDQHSPKSINTNYQKSGADLPELPPPDYDLADSGTGDSDAGNVLIILDLKHW